MFRLAVLCVLVSVSVVLSASDVEWEGYKAKFGKVYMQEEESVRRSIYEWNMKKVFEHNALYSRGLHSFSLGENQFSDMTTKEFTKTMNGFLGLRGDEMNRPQRKVVDLDTSSLPASVDWVQKGYVTAIKNQGQCGSCWSFSTTGALEGAHFKKTGRLVSLSEKNMMDCTWSYGNQGCNGGWMDQAFRYVIKNQGIDTEQGYPYYPRSEYTCRYNTYYKGASEVSYQDIPAYSETGLQNASATVGPISVAIDATHYSFQVYRSGIYYEPACSQTNLDHAVLVVGYGSENGQDYWLVKNSWGTTWGEKGYIRMARNRGNMCGIATKASYPTV